MIAVKQEAALKLLQARFREIGYTERVLGRLLGIQRPDDVGLLNRAASVERLREKQTDLARAARLFYLEDSVRRATLRTLLPEPALDVLHKARLLTCCRDGTVVARLRVDVAAGLLLLSDRRFRRADAPALSLPRGDMVYPPGSDSLVLAEASADLDGACALDLCAGSGIQALSLSARVGEVVAVDIGRRAAAMTTANALFNSVPNIRVSAGNLFAPVRGRRFDVILANPPFVPGPTRGPAYHSGGPRGDRVLRRIVAGLGTHLRPGGRSAMISHLALRDGEEVAAVVRPWVADFPGRVVVLVLEEGSIVDLAAAQALFALDRGLASYAAEVRRWVRFLRRRRLSRVVAVLFLARRGRRRILEVRNAAPRVLPLPLSKPAAAQARAWFAD